MGIEDEDEIQLKIEQSTPDSVEEEKNGGIDNNAAVLDITPSYGKGETPSGPAEKYAPSNDSVDAGPSPATDAPDEEKKKDDVEVEVKKVGAFAIFRFASCFDILLIIVGSIGAAAHGISLPLVLVYFGDVIDAFIDTANFTQIESLDPSQLAGGPNPFNDINRFSIIYVYLGLGVFVAAFLQSACWNLAADNQVKRIRKMYFKKVLGQDIEWFDKNKSGELTSRISDDTNKIRAGIGDKLGIIVQSMCTSIGGLVAGFTRSWQLSLVIVGVCFVLIVPIMVVSSVFIKKLSQAALDSSAAAGAVAEEVLSAIKTVSAFGGEENELKRYAAELEKTKKASIKKAAIEAGIGGAFFFVIYIAYAVAFGYGTYLILNLEDFQPGSILVTFFCILIGAFSLGQTSPSVTSFSSAQGAAAALFEVIEEEPKINCLSTSGQKVDNVVGTISLENVKFCYPTRPDVEVLKGISVDINVGQTVALVGSSGCGKSTIINLIQRFYDPIDGVIRLDGVDIRDLNVHWLRDNIGIVSQEPILFDTTIAENIRYGRLDVTDEEITSAAKQANAYDFIESLPEKFETRVGESGAQLSGGQKQRIAIARALVRNPKILLLDEATSALDTESEGIVQAALEKASAGRTTVVIAHRLSTIKNSDLICAFQEGQIVERGSHAELMNIQDGVYRGLVDRQQTKETAAEDKEDSDKDVESEGEEESVILDNKETETMGEGQSSKEGKLDRGGSSKRSPTRRLFSQTSVRSDTEKVEGGKSEDDIANENFSWSRALKLNAPESLLIFVGIVASALNGAIQPAFAVIFSRILKAFGGPVDELADSMRLFCILFVVIGVAFFFSQFLQGVMFGISGERLTTRLRHSTFKAMLRQEMGWFDDHTNSTGALSTRLVTDASLVQGVTGIRFGLVAEVFFNIVVAIIISFIFSWQLTLLILGFVPLMGIAGILQWKLYAEGSQVTKQKTEASGKLVSEAVQNIRTVQSLTREEKFHENYCALLSLNHRKTVKQDILGGMAFSFSQGIIYFAYAASFSVGGRLVENGTLIFDEVFLVFSAIVFGAFGLGRAFALTPDFSKAKMATGRIFQLIDQEPDIDVYNTEGARPEGFIPTVTFQKTRFRYPTRPDVPVLQGLSVMVGPGETLALVGSSGCGKSTAVALVERFYDPRSGELLLDTYDLKTLNLKWLRQQMGLVSQEPVLFDRTIAENIAYGDNSREVPQDEIEAAAVKANIHSFVVSLPEGYQTRVGNKGTQLSGGQKQRIAIARALVRNPQILLLDEATSALDTESEKVVQDALDEAKKGRTCITIAHRLSTIHDAEKIAVIRHGKVAEFGTHDELMQLKEQYYSLYTSQSLAT